MQNKNEMTPASSDPGKSKLRLTEIFFSIQGESSFMGLPCIFIRTTGCDLRCAWCDTEYAFYGGKLWTIEEIMAKIQKWPSKLVELTGGEPLLQKNVPVLAQRLLEQDYQVLIETGGHIDVQKIDRRVVKIMDIKCPGSGESAKNFWPNLAALEAKDQLKFVIRDRADYEWAVGVIHERGLLKPGRPHILMSPVFGVMKYERLAQWILGDGLPVRLQLQLHKMIWDPATRGV